MFAQLSKRPWIIAVVIAIVLLLWLLSGDRFVARDEVQTEPDKPATNAELARVASHVRQTWGGDDQEITPAFVAAGTSTLSRPTPARATTFSCLAAA